jgi:hypothetical protein
LDSRSSDTNTSPTTDESDEDTLDKDEGLIDKRYDELDEADEDDGWEGEENEGMDVDCQ